MNITEFSIKAISVPFRPKGRSWEAWDCWGLIYIAYKEIHKIELPLYDQYKSIKNRDELKKLFKEGAKERWTRIEEPEIGDVAIVYMMGRNCHIGLIIDKNKILHCEHGINTCIESLRNFRIEGFYKYGK